MSYEKRFSTAKYQSAYAQHHRGVEGWGFGDASYDINAKTPGDVKFDTASDANFVTRPKGSNVKDISSASAGASLNDAIAEEVAKNAAAGASAGVIAAANDPANIREPGFLASLTTPQKVALGVGVLAAGFLGYRLIKR